MAGNPNHGKDGKFSSGSASGHNAGKGNRAVAAHVKNQHSILSKIGSGIKAFVNHPLVAGSSVTYKKGSFAEAKHLGDESTRYYKTEKSWNAWKNGKKK